MNASDSLTVVNSYYAAFRKEGPESVADALGMVLDASFTLESPLVEARLGGPARGAEAIAVAERAAPLLQHVEIETLYSTLDGTGAVALIHFPSPAGPIVQSEHFDINLFTGKITRLRSYYDPRKLITPAV